MPPVLLQLAIRNIVLIEKLVLELGPGFSAITGETGAGKSMVVDALSLVLGGRARPELVRSGTDEAEVEALFELSPNGRVNAQLEAAGIPSGRELVVRRVVQAEGRSRAYVNGRLCTAAQLSELAAELCDIASQHESVALTDPSTHIEYLDAFGRLESDRMALTDQVDALAELVRGLQAASALERGRAEREDFLGWQMREIDEIDPHAGEEAELANERSRLRHADKLQSATRHAAEKLYEGEGATCDELARVAAEIDQAAAVDPSLAPFARTIESARAELADASRALARYADSVEANPERLAEVEERSFRLDKLLRKHGPTTADVIAHRAALAQELASLGGASDRVAELQAARSLRATEVGAAARALSRKRRGAAEKLADAIGRQLSQLGMGRARVVVEVTPTAAAGDALLVDGARLTRTGVDRVEFLIAPNRGEEPRPLRKIASGGELSRALLALKRVLAGQGPAGTYVFDEVDAGVGGAIAEVIGHAIADIARQRQVVCITHLPQIAALADAHFVVDKTETRGRTHTTVRRLATAERVDEIARMIGGLKVGDAARRAAEELLAAKP
jgi:DNA repair protein RecN (Recombination protein N)